MTSCICLETGNALNASAGTLTFDSLLAAECASGDGDQFLQLSVTGAGHFPRAALVRNPSQEEHLQAAMFTCLGCHGTEQGSRRPSQLKGIKALPDAGLPVCSMLSCFHWHIAGHHICLDGLGGLRQILTIAKSREI